MGRKGKERGDGRVGEGEKGKEARETRGGEEQERGGEGLRHGCWGMDIPG